VSLPGCGNETYGAYSPKHLGKLFVQHVNSSVTIPYQWLMQWGSKTGKVAI